MQSTCLTAERICRRRVKCNDFGLYDRMRRLDLMSDRLFLL
jgi:hypothetical protein